VFLLDSLLAAPGSAAFTLFKELARKAQEEWLDDDAIKQELQELYTLLEAGTISDRDFEARECRLLERLEQIARAKFQDKWGPSTEPMTPLTIDAGSPPAAITQDAAVEATPPPPGVPPAAFATAPVIALPIDVPIAIPAPAAYGPDAVMRPVPDAYFPPTVGPTVSPAVAPVVTPTMAPAAGATLSVFQVIESTMQSLALLKLRLSSITSVAREEEGWRVTAELVERKGVPDTNDLLGWYEFRLDAQANVIRYERTRMRRRGDLNR
jgi:hypothetical protein